VPRSGNPKEQQNEVREHQEWKHDGKSRHTKTLDKSSSSVKRFESLVPSMFASTRFLSSADLVTVNAPPETIDSLAELIISSMCNLSSSYTKAVSRARLDSHGTGNVVAEHRDNRRAEEPEETVFKGTGEGDVEGEDVARIGRWFGAKGGQGRGATKRG
jgi:hypothetical protein